MDSCWNQIFTKHIHGNSLHICDDAFCCVVVFVMFCEGHSRFVGLYRGCMIVVTLADVSLVHIYNYNVCCSYNTGELSAWLGSW